MKTKLAAVTNPSLVLSFAFWTDVTTYSNVMDYYATNPGPIDDSILKDQDKHVSAAVWEGQVFSLWHLCSFSSSVLVFEKIYSL